MSHPLRIVLLETSHPGNIGAAARAMKNMGLDDLWLVRPKAFPDDDATARASGADELLTSATVVDDLDQALQGCGLVVAVSARQRSLAWPCKAPREAAAEIVAKTAATPVALLFGREQYGLSNDELERCHLLISIPANPEYSSLNLAMAVQILENTLRVGALRDETLKELDVTLTEYLDSHSMKWALWSDRAINVAILDAIPSAFRLYVAILSGILERAP